MEKIERQNSQKMGDGDVADAAVVENAIASSKGETMPRGRLTVPSAMLILLFLLLLLLLRLLLLLLLLVLILLLSYQ